MAQGCRAETVSTVYTYRLHEGDEKSGREIELEEPYSKQWNCVQDMKMHGIEL